MVLSTEGSTVTHLPYTLIIGTKNWSSWSLRPWLLMKAAEIPFEEIEIPLRENTSPAALAAHSPSGKVPVLKVENGPTIWDSLAIAEFLAEEYPTQNLWPEDKTSRALARAIAAEMHSGFQALRSEMPMDVIARTPVPNPSPAVGSNIARIQAIWRDARARHQTRGPFLFGRFSIADAMFAPVVSRFVTYDVPLGPVETAYRDAVWALPGMQEWILSCAAWAKTRQR